MGMDEIAQEGTVLYVSGSTAITVFRSILILKLRRVPEWPKVWQRGAATQAWAWRFWEQSPLVSDLLRPIR